MLRILHEVWQHQGKLPDWTLKLPPALRRFVYASTLVALEERAGAPPLPLPPE